MNQVLDSQTTPSYRVSIVNICEETDHVITAPHCILKLADGFASL